MMNRMLNVTFFFSADVDTTVRATLRNRWVAALKEPRCYLLPTEEGVNRLCVQADFESSAAAEVFMEEVGSQIIADLTAQFGPERFLAVVSMMERVEL